MRTKHVVKFLQVSILGLTVGCSNPADNLKETDSGTKKLDFVKIEEGLGMKGTEKD